MRVPNIVGGIFVIAIAAFFYIFTLDFPSTNLNEVGPEFIPRVYCVLLFILGLTLLIQGLRMEKEVEEKEKTMIYALIAMAFVTIYIILIPLIGFYIATVLLVLSLLLFAKIRKTTLLITIPFGTILFIFIVFNKLLKVTVPVGSLFS